MDRTIQGKNGFIRVTDETPTGVVEVTTTNSEGAAHVQLNNGEVFALALDLLNVVEHTR